MNPAADQTTVLSFSPEDLGLTIDWILQGQGADPAAIRARRPYLVSLAERALHEGLSFLHPKCVVRILPVESLKHERLIFNQSSYLAGPAIGQHLAGAREVAVMVYTVGPQIEERIQAEFEQDAPFALALDGLANAAVDTLGNLVYQHLQQTAAGKGWQLSIFLSPGLQGWSVEQGQPQIFNLIDATQIGVRPNDSWLMIPRKSTSAVVGFGPDLVPAQGPPCEYCALNETCRYQGMHSHG
jgi:hypothetical protein